MHFAPRRWIFALLLLCPSAFADYGWIPEFQNFQVRMGADVSSTSNNFNNTGLSVAPTLSGNPVFLQDVLLWVQPEYGIAEDFSMGFKVGYLNGSASRLNGGAQLASGGGISDFWGSIKYRFSKLPLWTAEFVYKLPTGNSIALANTQIVTGEGNVDAGLKLHYGLHEGYVYLSASPGVLGRFGGYANALTMDVAAQIFIFRAYGKAFVNSYFSLSQDGLPPSTVNAQTLAGTAGSYARLAASPTSITAGAVFGCLITRRFRLEVGLSKTVWGQRAPDQLNFTVNLLGLFDFSTPDLRPKVREVPFESSGADS
jgi:hypothetical protein